MHCCCGIRRCSVQVGLKHARHTIVGKKQTVIKLITIIHGKKLPGTLYLMVVERTRFSNKHFSLNRFSCFSPSTLVYDIRYATSALYEYGGMCHMIAASGTAGPNQEEGAWNLAPLRYPLVKASSCQHNLLKYCCDMLLLDVLPASGYNTSLTQPWK